FAPAGSGMATQGYHLEGRRGVSGLGQGVSVAVTALAVYVVAPRGEEPGTIALFRRQPSGATSFVESVVGVEDPNAVVASPDDGGIFVAAGGSRSVEVFREERVCPD